MSYRLLACALVATGCTGVIEGVAQRGDDHDQVVVLQGEDLARELGESPVHVAERPFVRIGVMWEADRPGAIELSVSDDGNNWSGWMPVVVQHIEMELNIGNFTGQLEFARPITHYRVRSTVGRAEYVRLELLTTTMSESVEDGDGTGAMFLDPVGDANVHSRSEWGAAPTRCTSPLGSAYRMAIHHTETPTSDSVSPEARLRSIQSYHMNTRGWCDIGYHYLMSRDGRLWQGRDVHLLGAHTGGSNTGNIGIAVMGSHDTTPITDTQVDSLATLIRGLADRYGIAINRTAIKGHREYKSTTCPGDALFAQLDDIVGTAANAGSPPAYPPSGGGTVKVMGVLYAGSDTADRIAGATVTVGGETTTTNDVGLWQFDNVPEGSYTVSASAPGYEPRSITRTTYADPTWSSFGLSPATGTTTGTAVLQGVVYYTSDSSNRIANAVITLSTGETVNADENGFYRLTDLPAGPVTITASAPGWLTASVDRVLVDGETAWGSVRLATDSADADVGGPGADCTPCAAYDFLCCNVPANDMFYLTSFAGGGSMACGGYADGVHYYATSWVRWGCGAKLRVTNANTGACVVVEVQDAGPANWVEENAGGPILDASTVVCEDLFGSSSCGWSDQNVVEVVEVASDTAVGPAGCP